MKVGTLLAVCKLTYLLSILCLQYQAPRPKVKGSPSGLSSGVAPGVQSKVLSSAASKPGEKSIARKHEISVGELLIHLDQDQREPVN